MKSLRALAEDLRDLYNIEDLDEETFNDTLEGLTGTFEQKLVKCAGFLENLEYELGIIEEKKRRIEKLRKELENKCKWMRNYIISNMLVAGLDRVLTDTGDYVALKGKVKSVVWGKDKKLIPDCVKKPQPPKVNATLAKKYIEEHGPQPWGTLDEGKRLEIK